MSIAEKALAEHLEKGDEDEEAAGDEPAVSPSREALREAWSAVKANDFDGFADAVESLVEIKLAER